MRRSGTVGFVGSLLMTLVAPVAVWAQVTTGSVAGTVADAQGNVIPGATVILISQARGTQMAPVVTSQSGDFVVPNVTADTYTVEVSLSGFKTLLRKDVDVSGGDRVSVGRLMLEVGGVTETVNVAAEAPLIQTQSGERSFSIPTATSDNLPLSRANFANLAAFVPGVSGSGFAPARLGGGGQNNYQMDGVSTMDTGNNSQLIAMNMEAIAEVKVLTSAYQAEYGRSSGLQITAVTKGGTNQFRGSVYDVERNSDWNENTWVNEQNGDPKAVSKQRDWGYSIGGPIGRPGGNNKLFFFYSHEYRPRTSGGTVARFRVPTALERQGDFSQSLDNQGVLYNLIRDASSGLPCTAANTSGCFQDGGKLGKIPANRLYGPGLQALSYNGLQPLPNHTQVRGESYNLESTQPVIKTLQTQPAVRLDYQHSGTLRFTGKYAGQLQASIPVPGSLPGFNDSQNYTPNRYTWSTTVNWTANSTTFVEATYGFGRNALGTLAISPAASRSASGMTNLPSPFTAPDGSYSSVLPSDYYAVKVMGDAGVPYFNGTSVSLVPSFSWGNRISGVPSATAVPDAMSGVPQVNMNRSQDATMSVTKVFGRHTFKAGAYWNHAYKAQGLGAAGGVTYAGVLNFGNDTNNPLDSGFGFANAALGIFSSYQQQSQYVEGAYVYNNFEWYAQDNWRVTPRLTLDYGMRFVYMQPTYDTREQSSNFFLDQWSAAEAPRLYVASCPNNVNPCASNVRQAKDPLTGVSLGPNSGYAIGQIVSNSGDLANGIVQAGHGISKYNYTWPKVSIAPRFGMAYDLTGKNDLVVRGAVGLFQDRPPGDSMYSSVGNPPYSTSKTVRYARLAELSTGLSLQGPPQLGSIWPYETDVPASWQWNAGVQMTLPFAFSLDVSYVGQRGWNRLTDDRGLTQVDINAPDFGIAYLPQYQDPTLSSTVPGQAAVSTDLMRQYRGYGQIGFNVPRYWDEYHSIQASLNRRFRNNFSAGLNWTIGLSTTGNRGLQTRLQHAADGTYSIRNDQAAYEELNRDAGNVRHLFKGNFVYDLPDLEPQGSVGGKIVRAIVNDWVLSGILTGDSGDRYTIGFTYTSAGSSVNLTGSPYYPARVIIAGDPGSGCSGDQYKQFNTAAFAGPTYNSLGMESGRNYMKGCWYGIWDMAVSRNIRLGGRRVVQLRLEAFNAFNQVFYNGRVTNMQLTSPTNQTITNSQYLADGSLDPARMKPNQAGFGAVTSARALRSMQVQVRFQF
jgi:hypothetical protein